MCAESAYEVTVLKSEPTMTEMSPAEAIFFAALERPAPADRAAYLDEACANDPALRLRVEKLLAAHPRVGEFLEPAAAGDATGTFAPDGMAVTADFLGEDEHAGAIIAGKYALLEVIGEGGMGSVWRAKQSEPVKRFVAVKLIKAVMDSKAVLARFEAERQALAMMDHPNIAKILDGGLHDNRPYFVMELVKGVPITEYCDRHKLTPKERLELFVPVCQAIQHAHQKGIIHRDIKPSNVLIALYDDKPVPKVIDFGIAKATGGALTEHSIETAFGGVVGTPQYMSPEQASLNNLDIDTRSDVYSLGVLLYELLTGSPPFARKELQKAGLLEILRVVREEEPPRPSTKLSTADALPSLSANRSTEPKKLTGLLRNELDWIVMKALEKDRARRYETANGLAADVNRYLCGEAVLAHPPSATYRVMKFARRNRGQVIAASLVLLALLAGIAGTTVGLFEAKKQERLALDARQAEADRAEGERLAKLDAQANEKLAGDRLVQVEAERTKADAAKVEAQEKAAEANAMGQFFEDKVFAAARPKGQPGGLGAGVTLRDAVVASLPALEKGLADQPRAESRLRMALGLTFLELAEFELARDQFERSRALFTKLRGPEHPDTLKVMNNLAISYAGLNRPADALKLREETLAIQNRVLPKDDLNTLRSMINLAVSYDALNRPTDALKLCEETLAIQRRVLPKDHSDIFTSMNNLANSYATLNRPAEALKLREETLDGRRRALPKDQPDTLSSMVNVASSLLILGHPIDAAKLLEEALAIQKRVLPPDHPHTLACMTNLAACYEALNRPADAIKLREETLAIKKRVLPKDHPDTLTSMNNLAASYAKANRLDDAVKLLEETLEIRNRVLPKDHPDTLASMFNVAVLYLATNRVADAAKLLEDVRAIRKRALPKDHPDTLNTLSVLASCLIELGRGVEAVPLLDEFLANADASPTLKPQFITEAFELRSKHFQKTGEPAGCRATAEMWEKRNRTDAESLYTAARYRAIAAGVQSRALRADAAKLAEADATLAVQWLQKAVQAGYKDSVRMNEDSDLASLRERADFEKLLADLEKKFTDADVKRIAALPAAQQVEEVRKELILRNPRYDAKLTPKFKDGVVTELALSAGPVTNISPLRALHLSKLHLWGWGGSDLTPLKGMPLTLLNCGGNGRMIDLTPLVGMPLNFLCINFTQISDLAPLKNLPLTTFLCANTPVSDLTPLRGMRLKQLTINKTKVSDLSPLKGMPLEKLECDNSVVTDLSPLKDLPLKNLNCDFQPDRDAKVLRAIKTLQTINGKKAADFWKEVDANPKPAKD